jgi:P4 family phage/plasmid primase-like protien
MKNDPIPELLAEMSDNGFRVTNLQCDNQWHRFSRAGATSKKDCYYNANRIRLDSGLEILTCCYGDWKTGEQHLFRSSPVGNKAQQKIIKEALREARVNIDAEIDKAQQAAMKVAAEKWARGTHQGTSPYLQSKKIDRLHGAKIFGTETLVPVVDQDSNLVGLQTITAKGDKFFLSGQKVKGCFHVIGGLDQLEEKSFAYIVEGFATGCAVSMAMAAPVICAFSAGNLSPVCATIKKTFPFLKLIICADDDQFTDGNPGKTKASRAAIRFNAKFTAPQFKDVATKPTDFHDLFVLEGIEALKEQIGGAKYFATEVPPSIQLAEEFLVDQKLRRGNDLFLHCWQEQFFSYTGKKYKLISEADLFAAVMSFIQNHGEARAKAGTSLANNIIANLKGITNLPSSYQMPVWLDDPTRKIKDCINLENGIFNVEKWLKGDHDVLSAHSHNLFSVVCLPYSYDPVATCPKWLKFLAEVQPELDMRNLLQEWVGLNLVYDTSFCKFVLLVGEGANGKTVFCVVFRCLLGAENVSAVNLEGFDPKRTFQIAATIGKLANIVGELNQIDKAAEGELKKFVAGELVTAERKYEHPFELIPSARLTFATNILPRFADATDGLWRRLLLVPFNIQITDEAKQDKNLVNPDWWVNSGELPGIFNWALAGLKRLYERGHFVEPEISRVAKESYRLDSNPTRTFLLDNYEFKDGERVSTTKLYEAYSVDLKSGGHFPLSRTIFAAEVKRAFPKAKLTPHPRKQLNGSRCREWIGMCLRDE